MDFSDTAVSMLFASAEETQERQELAQKRSKLGGRGRRLCPDIRDPSPQLISQSSRAWGRARPVAGRLKRTGKQADLSERHLRSNFLTTREIRFLRDINR